MAKELANPTKEANEPAAAAEREGREAGGLNMVMIWLSYAFCLGAFGAGAAGQGPSRTAYEIKR